MSAEEKPEEFGLAIPGKSDRTFSALFDDQTREAEIKKGTDTSEKVLEKRRREYEELSIQLDACKNELLNAGLANLTAEQTKSVLLTQLVVGIPAIVTGLGVIIDCVSCQETRKIKKTGKRGTVRITAGRAAYDMAYMVSGLYGFPGKDGKVKDEDKGVIDETNDRLEYVLRYLQSVAAMIHMKGKHDDPKMFAGIVEDKKTGTKMEIDDLFDEKISEEFEADAVAARAESEKEYEEDAVLSDEEVEKLKSTPKKSLLEGIL